MLCGCKFCGSPWFQGSYQSDYYYVSFQETVSRKQKLNTKISAEAELVAVDDASVYVLWVALFIEWKGYKIYNNILYQYNKSEFFWGVNGKSSSGTRIRALNIRYF